jgi:hypothetical protein
VNHLRVQSPYYNDLIYNNTLNFKSFQKAKNLSKTTWPLKFIGLTIAFHQNPIEFLTTKLPSWKSCQYHPTTSPIYAIVGFDPTMTMVANPLIFNINLIVLRSIGKFISSNIETFDCIYLFMIHSKHDQMTCSEEDVYVNKSS